MKKLILILLLLCDNIAYASDYAIPEQYNLNKEELCLVQTIYFEARGESFIGQLAVANVILQRLNNKSFPDTICKVVRSGRYWKGNPIKNKCAFSYWCDGKSERMYDYNAYDIAIEVTNLALEGVTLSLVKESTHYHAFYVKPGWSFKMKQVTRIGKHIFYK